MKMKKKKTRNLNDGYIGIYSVKHRESGFAAVSPKSMDDLEFVNDLAYEELYKRIEDYEMASASGHELSLKVKTLLCEDLKKEYKVVKDGTMYNILKIDYAKADGVMYLYLEEAWNVKQN